jgi:uncharacterized membrane protein (UPF0127 family)
MRRRPLAVLALVLLASGCARGDGLPAKPAGGFDPPVTVVFDGAPELKAEVASRPDQRSRGLMQRKELAPGTGMLFVFPKPATGGFWMRGTLVPLSIAYVYDDRVVATAEMVPCTAREAKDCPFYPPGYHYTAAVEAPAGFFPSHGVVRGTRVRVVGATPAPS